MKKAILTTKVGMTQIFNEDGVLTPVTVLQAGPCVVTQVKTEEKDGQPLEVVAKHFYEAKFKRPKTRPYKTKNYYALLVQQADVEMEVNRIVQNSRKADSEE